MKLEDISNQMSARSKVGEDDEAKSFISSHRSIMSRNKSKTQHSIIKIEELNRKIMYKNQFRAIDKLKD